MTLPDKVELGTAALVVLVALFTGPGLFALRFLVKRTKTTIDDKALEAIVDSGIPEKAKDRLNDRSE